LSFLSCGDHGGYGHVDHGKRGDISKGTPKKKIGSKRRQKKRVFEKQIAKKPTGPKETKDGKGELRGGTLYKKRGPQGRGVRILKRGGECGKKEGGATTGGKGKELRTID